MSIIDPRNVHEMIGRYQLADGMPIVLDLDRSNGAWIHDARTGEDFLDVFTCFASWPLGYNHPGLADDAFKEELLRAASAKPSNSDVYTTSMASFVSAFGSRVTPPGFPYHFWVSGGTLAVENAMKTAFDWKARKLGRTDFMDDVNDLMILHFRKAFHGRSGYTLSVTNTLPDKVGLFPKFDWPRVHSPAMELDLDGNICNDVEAEEARAYREIEAELAAHPGKIAVLAVAVSLSRSSSGDWRAIAISTRSSDTPTIRCITM